MPSVTHVAVESSASPNSVLSSYAVQSAIVYIYISASSTGPTILPPTLVTLLFIPPAHSIPSSYNINNALAVADTGTTGHMCPDKFASISYHCIKLNVCMGNKTIDPILGKCTAVISSMVSQSLCGMFSMFKP